MEIDRKNLDRWAKALLDRCLHGIKPKDVVIIKGEPIAWPLIAALQTMVIRRGGVADVCLIPPDNERGRVWGATMGRHARLAHLKEVPGWCMARERNWTKQVWILGQQYPELTYGLSGRRMNRILALDAQLLAIRAEKPWAVTMYPTPAYAKMEGMPYDAYRHLVLSASLADPSHMRGTAKVLLNALSKTRLLQIRTRHPRTGVKYELSMDVSKGEFFDDIGEKSLPCGEVYTSPNASSVEGEIYLDLPVTHQGDDIEGIYLRFARGELVEYRARKGMPRLRKIVSTDAGARRIGEVAFGFNPQLRRTLKHPLFCEKLSGTMHIALGRSLKWCLVRRPNSPEGRRKFDSLISKGIANWSSQHVDMVVSFRRGGAGQVALLDGKPLRLRKDNWDVS